MSDSLCQHSFTYQIIRQHVVVCKLNRAGARVQALVSSCPFCLIVFVRWTSQRLFSLVSVDEAALSRVAQGVPGCSLLDWPPSLVTFSTLCLLCLWLCSHKITAKKLTILRKSVALQKYIGAGCCLVPKLPTLGLPSSYKSPATN